MGFHVSLGECTSPHIKPSHCGIYHTILGIFLIRGFNIRGPIHGNPQMVVSIGREIPICIPQNAIAMIERTPKKMVRNLRKLLDRSTQNRISPNMHNMNCMGDARPKRYLKATCYRF